MRKWGAPNPDNCDEIWLRHPRIPMDISQAVPPPQFAKCFAVFPLCFGLVHNIALQSAALCGRCDCTGPGQVPPPRLCMCSSFAAFPCLCLCRVCAVSVPCLCRGLPCSCRVVALVLPCRCPAFAMSLQGLRRVLPCSDHVVAVVWCVRAMALPCRCGVLQCICSVFAVWLPCRCLSCYCVIAVSLLLLRICCCSV